MRLYFWMAFKAFLISLVLTPIFRDLFRSYNVVDRPGFRKVHRHPIPRVGGIPIAIAYTISLVSITALYASISDQGLIAWKLIPGVVIIFATGLIDDFFNLKPRYKLLGQVVAAVVVFFNGLQISEVLGLHIPVWIGLPVTIFWLLLTTNALNLIDGLDGLCSGMGLFGTLTLFIGALIQGNRALAYATFPLAGALLGFLCFNFNPATVFLGDSGALLIGFLLGCFGLLWTAKATTPAELAVPLLALTIPLMDVSLSIVRRYLNNRPIFSADRGHIHHRLLDRKLTVRQAVFVLYSFASVSAGLGLLLSVPSLARYHGFVLVVFAALIVFAVRKLRYLEFTVIAHSLFNGDLKRSVAKKAMLERLSVALAAARTPDEWWLGISNTGREAGWSKLVWNNSVGSRTERLQAVRDESCWSFQIPLEAGENLQVEGSLLGKDAKIDLMNFAALLQQSRVAKMEEWKQPAGVR